MEELQTDIERDANVAVLAAVVDLAALRRPLSLESVLRDASRRLLQSRGSAVSGIHVQKHVQAAMERLHIERSSSSEPEVAGLLRYWA